MSKDKDKDKKKSKKAPKGAGPSGVCVAGGTATVATGFGLTPAGWAAAGKAMAARISVAGINDLMSGLCRVAWPRREANEA